ncbi:UNVERIFIED_CONTAM: hypothetical protein GTU68_056702 [Idotea baltica]|nr:hypothetical protein [Idotea baltica]MCL4137724.1 hypothetical protein [Idotea baltica]
MPRSSSFPQALVRLPKVSKASNKF